MPPPSQLPVGGIATLPLTSEAYAEQKSRRAIAFGFFCATHGTRTHDPRITNAMLYQLS